LANSARKRTVVVDYKDGAEFPDFKAAMDLEIASFRTHKCIEDVQRGALPKGANLISTRWVLTIKTKEGGTRRHKARLVARGFEDKERHHVTRDSPTASASSQRLILQALVERQWRPTSWDFETAFLQGNLIQRDIYLVPPPGCADVGMYWKLCKPVYGLVSAPKAWYDRLCEVVKYHGFSSDLSDEAIFRLRDLQGEIIGMLAVHVNDTIGGGTEPFYRIMNEVSRDLKIGSMEQNNFHYKGLRVSTVERAGGTVGVFDIVVDGDEYLDSVVTMNVPAGKPDDYLSPSAATDFRSVVGCLGYIASSFRPDLSLEASLLSRNFARPAVRDAEKANATLRWSQKNRYALCFRRGAASLTVFCDAAGPNEIGTQGGRLAALTDKESHRVSSWVFWESRKVRRVCRSTATAETLSLGEAFDTAMWLKQLWLELSGNEVDVRFVVDSLGVAKNLITTKLTVEKRLRIDLAVVRQGLRRGEFVVTWVPSRANLADALTKESESDLPRLNPSDHMKKPLLDALRSNCTNLRGVRQDTKTQADVSKY
jgi:Reverse transcriptase (RNA-dependent DNA polymerase)